MMTWQKDLAGEVLKGWQDRLEHLVLLDCRVDLIIPDRGV
jgi:hypothetical protein